MAWTSQTEPNGARASDTAQLEFVKPWGKKSWIVKYTGPYDNPMREKHVELRRSLEADSSLYDSMQPGNKYFLSNLRKVGKAVMWDVEEVLLDNGVKAHFTVHFGARPARDFAVGVTGAGYTKVPGNE
jgi:hypothetical protein